MYLIETTKEDLKLAKAEISALSNGVVKSFENLFIADCDYERLTLANYVYEVVLEFPSCASFKFEDVNVSKDEAFLYVGALKEKGAIVDLKSPEKIFAVIKFNEEIYLCVRVYTNPKEFLKRHPKNRPGFHPGACIPKFAKELVNLSGVKSGETLLDPFCGTGGMIIEAAFMGVKASGYDISHNMLDKTKLNLNHYALDCELKICDAFEIKEKFDVIVTELPFGKTTILDKTVPELLSGFLENLIVRDICRKVVVGLPSGYKYVTEGWSCTFENEVYIHKSLSKVILVLDRD